MVAPLGEKASPLEKDKASGASKDWSLCPLELIQALLELLHAPLQLIWAPLELPKALTMPFLSRNINIRHFWTNNFGLRARRIFLLAFLRLEKRPHFNYAWKSHIMIDNGEI